MVPFLTTWSSSLLNNLGWFLFYHFANKIKLSKIVILNFFPSPTEYGTAKSLDNPRILLKLSECLFISTIVKKILTER